MKTSRWVAMLLVLVLTLAFGGTALAEGGIEGVNSFSITPDSIWVGHSGTVYINANLTSGDGTTAFCLYISNALASQLPGSIALKYKFGFTFVTVTFSHKGAGYDDGDCPAQPNMTVWIYGASGLPAGDKTYSGSFTLAIPDDSSLKGNYNMIFFPEEPTPGGMEFAEAPFSVLGPSAVEFKGATARGTLPFGLLLVTLGLSVGLLLLRRRA